jgi:hypothetical protein
MIDAHQLPSSGLRWPGLRRIAASLFALVAVVLTQGCATTMIPGTEIPDTEENRGVWERVMEYRKAVETRDADAILAMTSRSYYENAATTDQSGDDYGYTELRDVVVPKFRDHVAEVQFRLLMRRIEVDGDRAHADYEYYYNVRYIEGGVSAWKPRNDFNRLEFVKEDGVWRISGGL